MRQIKPSCNQNAVECVKMTSLSVKLDNLDRRMIALLRSAARMSTSELARRLGISRSTVQGRMDRLHRNGVIDGFTIQFGAEYRARLVSAHVLIKVAQKLTRRVSDTLHSMPQIEALHAISGDYDLIAEVSADSTEELSALLDDIVNLPNIERTNSSVVLETKFRR